MRSARTMPAPMAALVRLLAEQIAGDLLAEVAANGTSQHADASANPDPCSNPCTDSINLAHDSN